MTKTINQRMTISKEDNFVVFLVGININHLWKLHSWIPSILAIPKILNELTYITESGFLGYQLISHFPPVIAEYWKSVDDLENHTQYRYEKKYQAWNDFAQKINQNNDVDIWHEIYNVSDGESSRIYNGMPVYGTRKLNQIMPSRDKRKQAV